MRVLCFRVTSYTVTVIHTMPDVTYVIHFPVSLRMEINCYSTIISLIPLSPSTF